MKTKDTTNWGLLLSTKKNQRTMTAFGTGQLSTEAVRKAFAFSDYAGEFRKLVRTNGTTYARRLTRKALRYRGILRSVSS